MKYKQGLSSLEKENLFLENDSSASSFLNVVHVQIW